MKIKLTIAKASFENNLLTMGFLYSIKEYDTLIESIKRKMKKDVQKAKTDASLLYDIYKEHIGDTKKEIFNEDYEFKWIPSSYLMKLINNGELDLFFKEKRTKKFKKVYQKLAYKRKMLSCITFTEEEERIIHPAYKILLKKNKFKNKITKCLLANKINLTNEEKETERKSVNDSIKGKLFHLNDNSDKVYFLIQAFKDLSFDRSEDLFQFFLFLANSLPEIDFINDGIDKLEIDFDKEEIDTHQAYLENIYRYQDLETAEIMEEAKIPKLEDVKFTITYKDFSKEISFQDYYDSEERTEFE